jgi:hypothetical protein
MSSIAASQIKGHVKTCICRRGGKMKVVLIGLHLATGQVLGSLCLPMRRTQQPKDECAPMVCRTGGRRPEIIVCRWCEDWNSVGCATAALAVLGRFYSDLVGSGEIERACLTRRACFGLPETCWSDGKPPLL